MGRPSMPWRWMVRERYRPRPMPHRHRGVMRSGCIAAESGFSVPGCRNPCGAAGTRRAYRMAVKRLLPETVPKKESRQQSLPNCFITISFPIRRGSWIRCPLPMRDAGWPATPIRSLMANCCSMLPVCWRRGSLFGGVAGRQRGAFSRQGPRRRVRTEPSYTCLYPSRNISQARLARIRFRRKLRGDARRRHPDNRDRRGPWELYG